MKSRITQEAKTILVELSKTSDEYLKFLYRIVYELKREINEGRNSNKEYFETLLEIREIEQKKAEAYRIRTKCEDQIRNEQLTTTLICKEKKQAEETNLKRVKKKNGETTEKMEDIMEEVKSFFKNVFTRETEEEKERVDEFFRKIEYNQVTEEENNILTVKLTKEEIKKAIMETENNKTPGLDGIPYEFYKTHVEEIAEHLADIFNELLNNDDIKIQCLGMMKLIPKKGSPEDLNNWRPVNITDCDYRIMSKVLANRLKKVLPSILSVNQRGGLENRKTADVLANIRDVIIQAGSRKEKKKIK